MIKIFKILLINTGFKFDINDIPSWISKERFKIVYPEWLSWIIRNNSAALVSINSQGYVIELGRRVTSSVQACATIGDLLTPTVMRSPKLDFLMPFQASGVNWLLQESKRILADDMGLGKTVQAVAAALQLATTMSRPIRILVVCPTSMEIPWVEHFHRFAPILTSTLLRSNQLGSVSQRCHVSIASFGLVRSKEDIQSQQWDLLIVDEAHRLRNEGTLIQDVIARLNTDRRWFLTGTPFERDSADLVGLLRSIGMRAFSGPPNRYSALEIESALKLITLRRTKANVKIEIPEPIEEIITVSLSASQQSAYKKTTDDINTKKLSLFAGFTKLRIISDFDPETGNSSKLDLALNKLIEHAKIGRKSVVFSFLLEPLNILSKRLIELSLPFKILHLRGDMSAGQRSDTVNEFIIAPRASILLASSGACAEGITLTVADMAILINEWWNPSTNSQIIARLVRFGQTQQCKIIKLRSQGTVDERLANILYIKSVESQRIFKLLESGKSKAAVEILQKLCINN